MGPDGNSGFVVGVGAYGPMDGGMTNHSGQTQRHDVPCRSCQIDRVPGLRVDDVIGVVPPPVGRERRTGDGVDVAREAGSVDLGGTVEAARSLLRRRWRRKWWPLLVRSGGRGGGGGGGPSASICRTATSGFTTTLFAVDELAGLWEEAPKARS